MRSIIIEHHGGRFVNHFLKHLSSCYMDKRVKMSLRKYADNIYKLITVWEWRVKIAGVSSHYGKIWQM